MIVLLRNPGLANPIKETIILIAIMIKVTGACEKFM
jgi:hypothetical protein